MVFELNRSAGIDDDASKSHEFNHSINSKKESKDEPSSPASKEYGCGGTSNIALDIEKKLEVGSVVESIDHAYILYCEYARYVGFSVRKGCQRYFDGSLDIRMKVFNCSCEGMSDNKRSIGRIAAYKKQVTRTNCKARLRVLRERDGSWIVSIFHKLHNHELVNPAQSYLLRSARKLSEGQQSILESLVSGGIPISCAYKFMVKESGGRENVGFIRKDAYAHMSRLKQETKVGNGDANALLQFFMEKSNNEPFFYWKVQVDDDDRLINFFFRDSRCAIDYEAFGDVLSVDTTYKTNKYDLICAPFVGINHHLQNVMFGLGFLSDETTGSFEWLFGAFLESMYGREPQVIFSDQCQALMNGVDYTFQTARHRLCQWHINQNAPSHFGSLNGDTAFKKIWHHCMNGCETEEEFEELWHEMIVTYDLVDNRWFRNMYNLRKRWSSVFTNDRFCGGLHATSRSEVTNRILKNLGKRSNSMNEFLVHFLEIQADWRARESAEDALCCGMPGQFLKENRLLTLAARILTRNVFKLFEFEATHSMNINIIRNPADYMTDELVFYVSSSTDSSSTRHRRVVFNKSTLQTSCSCHMWETKGVLCRHVFKVYYLLNVASIPEEYLLRRWRRDAKHRCPPTATGRSLLSKKVPDIDFVNQMMRLIYEMAHESKGNAESRSRLRDIIFNLCHEEIQKKGGNASTQNKNFGSANPSTVGVVRNPALVKSRGFSGSKRKGGPARVKGMSRISKRGKEASTATPKDDGEASEKITQSPQPEGSDSIWVDSDIGHRAHLGSELNMQRPVVIKPGVQERETSRLDASLPYSWL